MSEQGFTITCQRSGRGRGCVVVRSLLDDFEIIKLSENLPPTTANVRALAQCCLCPAPATVVGPRGSRYCALCGRCSRCKTSVAEFRQDGLGIYICPCYWDWDAATKQRKVVQPTLMSGHYQYGGKV